MHIIQPVTVTSARLTASNVPETDYDEWLIGTAYTAGDNCIVIGTTHKIYEALVDVTGGDSPEIDVLNDVPKWLEISATNRWKAFDTKVGTETSQADLVTYEITPGAFISSLAFLGMECKSIQIISTDPIEGEIYNVTIDMSTSGIFDWYSYFFSGSFFTTDTVRLDLPLYLNAVISISVSYTGGTVLIGAIILGVQSFIGLTQYSPSIGIRDYSIKQTDEFGITTILERAYSKRMTVEVLIESGAISEIQNLLEVYRTSLIVWVGDDSIPALIVYGFYKDFNILISYPTFAICSLDILGLT